MAANGTGIGMIYFLLSVGLLRFVNFAHGAFYMAAAYIAYAVAVSTGTFWWALVLGPLLVAALALVVLLWVAIERTRLGSILRAGSESAEMVGLRAAAYR